MIAAGIRRLRRAAFVLLALAAGLSPGGPAAAHASGSSYLRIESQGQDGMLPITWDISAADLELPLELDADGDGDAGAEEIAARRPAIARFAIERLDVRRGGEDCRLSAGAITTARREGQPYVSLRLVAKCPRDGSLAVSTRLFFGSPGYTALLDVRMPGGRHPAVLSAAAPDWNEQAAVHWIESLWLFAQEGVHHVLIGYDHVAFLLLLLLPCVLRGSRAGWTAVADPRAAAHDLVRIVTAFTVAHSITLGLAVTGVIRLPVRPIELAIAGSIMVAGVLNLFPRAARWRLGLAFGFGLVHGCGFANAFHEIGGEGTSLAPMLGGFNLGVEAGQLLLVAVSLPILWLLARSPRYPGRIMPGLSVATALTGAVWFVGRL